MSERTLDTIVVFGVFVVLPLIPLIYGGCRYEERKHEMQKLEAQAAGKLPPDNIHVYRLDEEQFNRLIKAIQGGSNGNGE